MSELAYFQSLTQEMNALKNRVRHFIKDRHWLSDGLWKESVLRAILRRQLPQSVAIGTGFIVSNDEVSTQIDILIYDTDKPVLFRDGDFIVVTPDLVRAIIEVKTRITKSDIKEQITKLGDTRHLASSTAMCHPFVGLFSYDNGGCTHDDVLNALDDSIGYRPSRKINCVSIGDDLFTRYWECPPETPRQPNNLWRSYNLNQCAPAYFVHNVIESLFPRSVKDNDSLWYPTTGKESHMLGEREIQKK